jgi:ABC-type nickel/cobalt efflux system permease component RcnA
MPTDDLTLLTLLGTAVSIGFVHTLAGPDHYVPFIAMSKAGRWSLARTLVVTTLCGVGHVASSVVLGLLGVATGTLIMHVAGYEKVESFRGDVAGWLLLGFGIAYTVWGVRRAIRNRPHTHWHSHADGTVHSHEHTHDAQHAHVHEGVASSAPLPHGAHGAADAGGHRHEAGERPANLTPWILFTIFVFGPCEPLIPLLMVPAAKMGTASVALVATAFGAATIATMLALVLVGVLGLARVGSAWMTRHAHALAGGALTACGLAVVLGL